MIKANARRLKLGLAILCIALSLGTLPSIYLIGIGLLDHAVVSDEHKYFQMKLIFYSSEAVILGVIAAWLLKKPGS